MGRSRPRSFVRYACCSGVASGGKSKTTGSPSTLEIRNVMTITPRITIRDCKILRTIKAPISFCSPELLGNNYGDHAFNDPQPSTVRTSHVICSPCRELSAHPRGPGNPSASLILHSDQSADRGKQEEPLRRQTSAPLYKSGSSPK